MKFKFLERISKDELDELLLNQNKQNNNLLSLVSQMRVEFDKVKETYKNELKKRLEEKDKKIKELEDKLNKMNQKYV